MTGAGSGTLAFAKEQSFLGSLSGPNYYHPGHDPQIQEFELPRALNRQRKPGQVFADDSVPGLIEGAFGVEFTMDSDRQADVHDIVFNASSPYTLTPGLAATSRWYVGVDYITATAERELKGCAPIDYSVSYTESGDIRVAITFIYADEERKTSITPSSISEATGSAGRWHGMDLTIDGTVQSKEQSATLSLTNLSRFQPGSEAIAVDAVVGAAEATLSLETILTETDQQELAYGGAGQSTTSKTMSNVAGSMELSAGGSTVTTYSLAKLKPDSYSWNDVINDDADTSEGLDIHINGDPAVSAT